MATIAHRIFELAAEQFGVKIGSLSINTYLDSLDRLDRGKGYEDFEWWLRFLEIEWGISIPREDQLALNTLRDLISYVQEAIEEKKVGQANQPPHNPVAA